MRLIDRDVAIQRIKAKAAYYSHETAGDFDTGRKLGLIDAEEVIADMPIIEVETAPLHSDWYCNGSDVVCGNCNYRLTREEWFNGCDWNYCPQCGARMDDDTDE